jgi:RNA polymerase sigma factor for flagellar operon FliA
MPRKKQRDSSQRVPSASSSRLSSGEALRRRNALIEEYQEFVETVVARLTRSMNLPTALRDEFISAGFFGLIEAASRFDDSRGLDFRSYSFIRIRGSIIDYIRTSCTLSGHAYRTFRALEAAQEIREFDVMRRTTSVSERSTGDAPLRMLEKSALACKLAQLREPRPDELRQEILNPERILQKKREFEKIRAIVATLPEKERTIIEQYYFHDRKFVEVASHFAGLSKSWVSRLHDRALEMLREKLSEVVAEMAA